MKEYYQALKQLHRLVRFYPLKALAMCMKALNVTCIWLPCRVEPISAAVFSQVFQRNRFIAANYKAHALEWLLMYLMLKENQLLNPPAITLPTDSTWERGVLGLALAPGTTLARYSNSELNAKSST